MTLNVVADGPRTREGLRRRSDVPPGLRWSASVDPPSSGPDNMARDHAVAAGLPAGTGHLRLYRWDVPTISFGRNEPVRGRYDRGEAARMGVAFVRRPSGGRAVLHDRELTYALVLPVGALGGPRAAYRTVNAGFVDALRALGVPAELAPPGRPAPPHAGPCFGEAADGEVSVAGRKLVGSAQVRIGGALLQHGSLLLEPSQGVLEELGPGPARPSAGATSLLEVTGSVPSWEALVSAVRVALAGRLGGGWSDARPEVGDGEAALRERYASEAWTWRR